jgi:hypothetical protein
MELHRFLSLLAALLGLIGAIFLSKGVLALTPKTMLHLTTPHSRTDYAPEQIRSLATQKADTSSGVIYVLLAFSIQAFSLIFVSNDILLVKSRWMGFWVAVAIVAIFTVVFSIMNIRIRDYYTLVIGKIEVKNHCADSFLGIVEPVHAKELEGKSKELLNLKREESETQVDFIKRISEYVGYSIPKDTDFSKIESNK